MSPAQSYPPKAVGDLVLGKYRIVRELGSGAMGRVFEAVHVGLDRRFALKFLRASRAIGPSAVKRLEDEARAAGSLENEHIAAVTDFGFEGVPFLVMEYLEGEDLAALLARYEVLPVTRAVDLVLQACHGLRAAHARGIIHRDLKPANLFVTRGADGTDFVKVLDFGIATEMSTVAGRSIGTPRYMAPEQARGESLDAATDVYALGVVLFECLCGTWPHDGETTEDVLFHLLNKPPLSLSDLRPDLPEKLTRAVDKAVSRGRADRFKDVDALSAAIAPFGPALLAPAEPEETQDIVVPIRRVPNVAIGLALAIGVALAFLLLRQAKATPAPPPLPVVSAAESIPPVEPAPSFAPVVASTRPAPIAPEKHVTAPAPKVIAAPAPSSRFDRTNPY